MDSSTRNAKQTRLLWVDLEMTGLDPAKDRILEVAAIVTDWDFTELATYEAAIRVAPKTIETRMLKGPAAQFWDAHPTVRDALVAQNNENGRPVKTIEDELIAFVTEHFPQDTPVILAGNSIHQDRKFIDREWPRLNERLHYRMLDVSSWKVVLEGKYRRKFAKQEAHRALDDIRGSIEELKYYLKKSRW